MKSPLSIRFILPSFFLALSVNIMMFSLLPSFFSTKTEEIPKTDNCLAVRTISYTEPKPPKKVEKRPPKEATPEKVVPRQKVIPDLTKTPDIPDIDLDIDLSINPDINTGMAVEIPLNTGKGAYAQEEVDRKPTPLFQLKPMYPYQAKRMNINGQVEVRFMVESSGDVSHIEIIKADPPGIFEDSVRRALSSWRFSPGMMDGENVSTWMKTVVEFNLEGA